MMICPLPAGGWPIDGICGTTCGGAAGGGITVGKQPDNHDANATAPTFLRFMRLASQVDVNAM